MVVVTKILVLGDPNCQHNFIPTAKEWDELTYKTGDPEKDKRNTWHYNALVDKCTKCGREELRGGNILVPQSGDCAGGEYNLESDGSRGMWIGD